MDNRKEQFISFLKFVLKAVTRILFKIKRQKGFNEKEIFLMKRLHFEFSKYFED